MKENIILETKNLTKYYGSSKGIENVNLKINEGEIFGLLGPNGAGKTTTIRVLLDLIRKTSGEATIFGLDHFKDSVKVRERIAYLPGELGLYKGKTARQNLNHLLNMYNKPVPQRRIEEIADRIDLELDRKIDELSKGNKQKVGIILVLAPETDLLILDEPTSGLDPLIMANFYTMLFEKQKENGTTVLLSSHRLEEVERVAQRVGVIRKGTVVEVASIDYLKKIALKEVLIELPDKDQAIKLKSLLPSNIQEQKRNGLKENEILFTISRERLSEFFQILSKILIVDVNISSPALEDIFMKYYEIQKSKSEDS